MKGPTRSLLYKRGEIIDWQAEEKCKAADVQASNLQENRDRANRVLNADLKTGKSFLPCDENSDLIQSAAKSDLPVQLQINDLPGELLELIIEFAATSCFNPSVYPAEVTLTDVFHNFASVCRRWKWILEIKEYPTFLSERILSRNFKLEPIAKLFSSFGQFSFQNFENDEILEFGISGRQLYSLHRGMVNVIKVCDFNFIRPTGDQSWCIDCTEHRKLVISGIEDPFKIRTVHTLDYLFVVALNMNELHLYVVDSSGSTLYTWLLPVYRHNFVGFDVCPSVCPPFNAFVVILGKNNKQYTYEVDEYTYEVNGTLLDYALIQPGSNRTSIRKTISINISQDLPCREELSCQENCPDGEQDELFRSQIVDLYGHDGRLGTLNLQFIPGRVWLMKDSTKTLVLVGTEGFPLILLSLGKFGFRKYV